MYTEAFFNDQKLASNESAKEIIPLLFDAINPKSVVDVGCGVGTWLAVCEDMDVKNYLGIDGDWVTKNMLLIPSKNFAARDLTKSLKIKRVFDVAMSLEVAEHLPEKAADFFIESLTQLSDVVFFSAAIPGQTGTNHINEQWQEYWAQKFINRNYIAIDYIRPRVWKNTNVKWWYAQNILLYIHKRKLKKFPKLKTLSELGPPVFNVVHPENYLIKNAPLNRKVRNYIQKLLKSLH